MRTFKTGLSVFLSVLVCLMLGRTAPTMAVLGAVFSLRQGTQDTLSFGFSRIFGNILGGIIAIISVYLYYFFPNDASGQLVLLPLGVMAIIIVCNLTNNNTVIVSSTATFVTIFVLSKQEPNIYYAFERVIDTGIGSLISYLVNRFVFPYSDASTSDSKD